MGYLSIILGILVIILLVLVFIFKKRSAAEYENTRRNLLKEKDEDIKKATKKVQEYDKQIKKLNSKHSELNNTVYRKTLQLDSIKEKLEFAEKEQKSGLEKQVKSYFNFLFEREKNQLKDKTNEVNNCLMIQRSAILEQNEFAKEQMKMAEEIAKERIIELRKELEELNKKTQAANQEILRRREIEEKEDFYKLNLSENEINDMKILKGIEDNLKNRQILDKLLYESFVRKPATELVKRITEGRDISGIYRIIYIPTGEAYIGKATHIDERWIQHIKSAFNLGTIANSALHVKMRKEGVWNFTFEIIEEVPKDKLTEREKYWIEYYDTKTYGLNERLG